MNTQDKLQRIKAKCEELIHRFPPCESVAGWQSTIAAIDLIVEFHRIKWGWDGDCGLGSYVDQAEDRIIEAWPEELL